jgi:hypothetical protein
MSALFQISRWALRKALNASTCLSQFVSGAYYREACTHIKLYTPAFTIIQTHRAVEMAVKVSAL